VDTFDLLPSLADGELAESSAPELVAAIFRSRASGTLTIDTPQGEVRQFFRAGLMCGSAYFAGFHTLAQVLLKYEWANALDIDSSLADAQEQKRRHGEVLLEQGVLTREQLDEALVAQHRHNLMALMRIDRGHYELRGWEPPPGWTQELNIDPVATLFDALAEERMAKRRGRILLWLEGRPAGLTPDWEEIVQHADLLEADQRAISLLSRPRTRSGFLAVTRIDPARSEALLSGLLLIGGAEPRAPAPMQPRSSEPPPPSAEDLLTPLDQEDALLELLPDHEAFPSALPGADERTGPAEESEVHDIEEVDEIVEEAPLQQGARAPAEVEAEDVDEVEIEHIEELAPAPPIAAPPAPSDDLRKRLRAQGQRNLAGQLQAAEPPARKAAVPWDEPAAPASVSPEAQQMLAEVRARLAAHAAQSPWQRLGVAASASQEQIRAAYLDAVRKFHPDRAIALGLGDAQPELQLHFAALQEAYDRIGTPAARAAYEQHQAKVAQSRPPSKQEEAQLAIREGDVLLKKRDFPGALARLRRALELAPTSDAMAALAWGLLCDPSASAEQRVEAQALVDRALRAPEPGARTHYVAGVLRRALDPAAAEASFRKALELEPSHAAAAQELRLLELRAGKKPPSGSFKRK